MFLNALPIVFTLLLFIDQSVQASEQAGFRPMPPPPGITEKRLSEDRTALALDGFDPVSYFLEEGQNVGKAEFQVLWQGVSWRFASEANRQIFLDSPELYAPQLGGHASEGLLNERLIEADPRLYAVHANRLYLFRSESARQAFLANPALFQKARQGWLQARTNLLDFGA
jgi:YHS domain-containing protein